MTGQRYIEIVDPIRKQKGWSKGEFCRRIGVSPNMYGNYRNGTKPGYIDKNAKDNTRQLIENHVRKMGLLSETLSETATPHDS